MSTVEQISKDAEADGPGAELTALPKRRVNKAMIAVVVLIIVVAVAVWYRLSLRSEETDDAQVDAHLVPITARVEGTIQAVNVEDNQIVSAGDLLVQLDPRDNRVALDQAKAQSDQASAQLTAANPNLPITKLSNASTMAGDAAQVASAEASLAAAGHDLVAAEARLKESQANNERAQANLHRYQTLLDKGEVARVEYDQYKAAASAQAQTVIANEAAVASSEKMVEEHQAQLNLQQSKLRESQSSAPLRIQIREAELRTQRASAEAAQAAVDRANLNLGYGRIVSPVSGVVTERSAEPGSRVSPGQQLMMVVQTGDLWVTANFKETQLARMHPGQKVKLFVDALHEDFDGVVESMPAVTGSRTSVLPPENATGNYVKVIQRMPVRIRFLPGQAGLDKLRPGMSVEPKVYVE
jgi:membrane fusion protein (multidrug efflux system)